MSECLCITAGEKLFKPPASLPHVNVVLQGSLMLVTTGPVRSQTAAPFARLLLTHAVPPRCRATSAFIRDELLQQF